MSQKYYLQRSAMCYDVAMRKEVPISIRLDSELRKKLEELAEKDLRTLSDYIRATLIRHVEKQGGKQ
jgi:predicted transcriptional regulator